MKKPTTIAFIIILVAIGAIGVYMTTNRAASIDPNAAQAEIIKGAMDVKSKITPTLEPTTNNYKPWNIYPKK